MLELDVVIPVRDVDDYLADAIDSALAQEHVMGAVIVVDAGSVRPVTLSPQHLENPRVHLVRSELPLTAGGARNLGMEQVRSEWLAFLDADDLWPADSRRRLIDAGIESHADLVAGTMTTFHSDELSRQRIAQPLDGARALVPGGVVIRRAAWERIGPFDATLSSAEFIEWYNRFTALGLPEIAVPVTSLHRRLHLASTTAGRINDRGDYLEVVRRWMNRTSS